jgi:hypothetical protein
MLSEGRGLKSLRILLSILLVPGLIVFALGALRRGDIRVWEIYLVNLLFWSGLSQAGVTVSALLHTTNGKWGKNITHIMEGMALFSPVALVLFLVLYIGDDTIFVWVREPVPEKAFLLDITHFFVRENFNLIVLNIFNLVFLYHSFRPDVGAMLEEGSLKGSRFFNWFTSGWRGFEAERERSDRALRWLSPVILFVYAVVYSMIAYDFVMSLDPYWYSTLFGAYYFMTNLYLGIAGIAIVVILVSRVLDLGGYVTEAHFRDIGLMLFVFCLIALDFFWSQYLVIWYGNIPEEITFLVNRIKEPQWLPVSLAVLAACFLLPFLLLLSRPAKKKPRYLLPIAILVFVGMWLERYLLVVPTLWHGSEVPLGFTEFAVTIAFMAAFVLVYIAFAKRFPLLPSDARARGTNGWGLENA